ncbi:MAG: ATP-grasp domain-containing protein [Gammaproteobacteria bacterium]|nr:ATP-grasp domain-containing protein [Gammaproteobacteria bacterium]
MPKKVKLKGLSEIFSYFRKNTMPWYFLSPTPFNVLGLDQWVRGFEYLSYFDCFEGSHPRVVVPKELGPREFQSMEEMCNFLLKHKEIVDHINRRGPGGKLMLVMFDEETEALAKELGLDIALPSAELRNRLDSKIVTTQLGNEAGVSSVPNVLGRATDYKALNKLAKKAKLGSDLVVQTPYGDSGRTTFFINSEDDWDKHASNLIDEKLKVMKRINHMPGTVEAVATRHGTLSGPMMTDLTGYPELTPYRGGWCGNDIFPGAIPKKSRTKVRNMVRALGDRLYQEGYRGCFCVDYLMDSDTGEVYLSEVNPRISGASPPTNLITSTYGGVPLMLIHMLEFADVDYTFDIEAVQTRRTEFDTWCQLILKQTEDKVELITKAPSSGIWRLGQEGDINFVRQDTDWHKVVDEDEFFYLRVYGAGEYRYHGADMGVVVTRGRIQTNDRQLMERARLMSTAIFNQFEGTPPAPEVPVPPPMFNSLSKMF